MDSVLQAIESWVHDGLVQSVMSNFENLFEGVNGRVASVAGDVATSPQDFSPAIFDMIKNISETVIMPIAGLILTFIACMELIDLIIEKNNMANFETFIFFKWLFKTFVAVLLVTNTFNIVLAFGDDKITQGIASYVSSIKDNKVKEMLFVQAKALSKIM